MFTVAALYSFFPVDDPQSLRERLGAICKTMHIFGALIVAKEGINGTIAGLGENLTVAVEQISSLMTSDEKQIKFSYCDTNPFVRMRISIKQEIVTMGCPEISPTTVKGKYVDPKDWNDIICDPDVLVLDTRNSYEVQLGTFKRAVDPNTTTFKEFPPFVQSNLNPQVHRKVAMFCTGGIRCEKASSFMLSAGFEEVFHLKGGILKYLEDIAPEESLWEGQCYVFDQRVSVSHGLVPGNFTLCHSCRHPLSPADLVHEAFEEGVTCSYCIDSVSETKLKASRERQLQMVLARKMNRVHLGQSLI